MNRFEAILQYSRPGHPLYDLCCDHGFIGLSALKTSSKLIFVDQSSTALESLRRSVTKLSEDEKARIVILEMPAQKLSLLSESSDIVIAGIGVNLMINILDGLFPQGLAEHRLILAPQKNSLPLRAYLRQRGFKLFDETVVKERGRYREILVIEKDGEEVELMGNHFGNEKDGIARDFHEHFLNFHRTILRQRSEVET